ncbi:MAG: sensor histidine kinase [Leptolyngbya sp. IPPAS B-1204]|nr:HAMP domain-containing histidine kinase [Elainella sp. C42_A2020_010]RNJ67125.1 MAG: sensor histidine kinase [Leptolyngbya sp. IPPAS B-1204]
MGWTDLVMLAVGFGAGALLQKRSMVKHGSRLPVEERAELAASQPVEAPDPVDTPVDTLDLQTLQTQLQKTQAACRMAQQSERFKAGFLARTSHELRSPLNSVMSLQQLILSDLCEDPAEEREFIAQAYAAAQKMLGLLDKLISVSKAGYGTEQLQIQPVCLEDMFMEMESLTLMQAQNRNQRLKIEYPDADLWVLADPRWFKQVLVSLVDTPIGLMQEGEIHVMSRLVPEVQEVRIQVADQRPASFWSEPIDWLQTLMNNGKLDLTSSPTPSLNDVDLSTTDLDGVPSAAFSLLVNQTVLELMGGRLEVVAVPSEVDLVTRLECVVPWAKAESESQKIQGS